jgi:hypothetical protein
MLAHHDDDQSAPPPSCPSSPREVPMPRLLAQRPRDRRGYPITAVTAILPGGLPDFAQIDQRLVLRCALEDRCGLCGASHGDGGLVAFLGPLSAVDDPLAGYGNPPMHIGCAEAAVRLCPYIAHRRACRRAAAAPSEAALAALGLLAPPAKPDPWALVATRTWTARIAGHTFVRPRPPLRLPAAGAAGPRARPPRRR